MIGVVKNAYMDNEVPHLDVEVPQPLMAGLEIGHSWYVKRSSGYVVTLTPMKPQVVSNDTLLSTIGQKISLDI